MGRKTRKNAKFFDLTHTLVLWYGDFQAAYPLGGVLDLPSSLEPVLAPIDLPRDAAEQDLPDALTESLSHNKHVPNRPRPGG